MLDVRRLALLEAVARHGSITAAAHALDYTQSAVSQQIATLEREIGADLLVRSGRRIWFTNAGDVLTAHARRILAAVADAEADMAALTDLRHGTVRLAAFPSAGADLVPQAAATFRREHPGVRLILTAAEPRDAFNGLRSGAYDLIVTLAEVGHGDRREIEVERYPILDDPFSVVLPPGHRLAGERVVRLGDLADDAWIATSPHGHPDADTVAAICEDVGFSPRVLFHIDDYLAVQGFIAADVGVALIPQLALSAIRSDVVVRPVTPTASRQVEAVAVASRRQSPGVLALLDSLRLAAKTIASRPPRAGA
jgi:molybdate transport repressor ModE-like protein